MGDIRHVKFRVKNIPLSLGIQYVIKQFEPYGYVRNVTLDYVVVGNSVVYSGGATVVMFISEATCTRIVDDLHGIKTPSCDDILQVYYVE
mmetsp:Transcript_26616/g.39549  ORF Transcript_26616/g.39549 Transcript_26616/m.39549 type:complete len:90 (-) Transcript_26616:340-609(-)